MGRLAPAAPALALLLVAATPALAACDGDGAVELSFRPAAGAQLAYRTTVETETVTDVPCQAPSRRSERAVLDVAQRVLEVGDDGVRVEVALSRNGVGTRTVVVRFDRAAQLTTVEEVEGIPAAALGELGLSEIFPPAAGAPPERPLAPGDRWEIDDEVRLDADAAAAPARLTGRGRLVALGVEDGVETATIETTTTLTVATEAVTDSGSRALDGEQVTEVRATYDLADGALRRATALTRGDFDLVLGPPPGGSGDDCAGTLAVELRSEVERRG